MRFAAKQESREARTGQSERFAVEDVSGVPATFEVERSVQRMLALERLRGLLREGKVACEDALASLLELPLVWEADVKRRIMDLRDAHEIDVVGLNERTPKKGHVLVRRDLG